ncbi:MAG: RpoL/Rpb11 RNA polymerase subunit family protein [Candidatus Bathyarchaeia archaeon]
MKVTIVKSSEKELKLDVQDANRALLHLLQKILLRNGGVEVAGYDFTHPLLKSAVLYIKTKGSETPLKALDEAAKELIEEAKDFEKLFLNALKEYRS